MHDSIGLDLLLFAPEHHLLRDQLQRLVRAEIAPAAPDWERDGRVPAAMFERLGGLGLLGLAFPEEHGGSGLGARGSAVLSEELGRSGFGGLTASITVHSDMSALHLSRAGSDEQRARFLPDILAGRRICALGVTEPRGGSDLTRLATTATRNGDGYVLNGGKYFITNANIADLFFVIARTDPAARGAAGFTLFLIERGTPGFSTGARLAKTGWHSSDTGELVFDDCHVPVANRIGEEGRGFQLMMKGLDHERLCAAAQALGLADKAMNETLAWVRGREAYGRTLWDLQVIRQELAKLAVELVAARTLTYAVAAKADRGEPIQMEGAMLKAHVPALGDRILYKCVQYHGGAGYLADTPVERISRDIRNLSIGGGATEVMYDEVAKRLVWPS